jgi:hypothetical protein
LCLVCLRPLPLLGYWDGILIYEQVHRSQIHQPKHHPESNPRLRPRRS